MAADTITVTYRLETSGDIGALADKIASDQSTGTFTDLPGETAAVQARCAARVVAITPLENTTVPSIPDPGGAGPYKRADVAIAFPLEAVGSVTHCALRSQGWRNVTVAGVSFLTLRILSPVGGFVSHRV